MFTTRLIAGIFSVVVTVLGTTEVSGQNYPARPIRIVTSDPGGGADIVARLIAQGIAGTIGQPLIVDNRGGGVIPGQIVSKATPDGYTLLLYSNGLWINPLLQKVPYDVEKDFAPITLAISSPGILVVHPSVPVKSVKELIALLKDRPGELNYAGGSLGSGAHLAAELFKQMAAVNIVRISYKGVAGALIDLIDGRVQMMFPSATSVSPHVKAGRLRALAITGAEPSALYPGLPTVAASGVPGYEAVVINALWAPAKTPAAVVGRLNQEVVRFLNTAEAKERLLSNQVEPVGSSPEKLAATVKSDVARWGKVIKEAGIIVE